MCTVSYREIGASTTIISLLIIILSYHVSLFLSLTLNESHLNS